MKKTTVYLTTERKAALADAARQQGRSEARLIRDGIDEVLAGHVARETPASLADQPGHDVNGREELGVRPRWVSREAFVDRFVDAQADLAQRRAARTRSGPRGRDAQPVTTLGVPVVTQDDDYLELPGLAVIRA